LAAAREEQPEESGAPAAVVAAPAAVVAAEAVVVEEAVAVVEASGLEA